MGNPSSKFGNSQGIRLDRAYDFSHYRDAIIKNRSAVYRRKTKNKKGSVEIMEKMSIGEFNRFIDTLSKIYNEFYGKMEDFFELLNQV